MNLGEIGPGEELRGLAGNAGLLALRGDAVSHAQESLAPAGRAARSLRAPHGPVFRACVAPAFEGLRRVARGGSFTGRAGEGRRFLGWVMGKHWLTA